MEDSSPGIDLFHAPSDRIRVQFTASAGPGPDREDQMPRFPERKAEKDALYSAIVAGITANPALYPSGAGDPFELAVFNGLITAKNTAKNTRQNEEGQFRNAVATETDAYDDTDDESRRLIDLAMATHGKDSPHLTLIGWGPTADRTSNIPGQPRQLEAVVQAPGAVFLDWKAPAPSSSGGVGEGGAGEPAAPPGKVSYYKVQRRKRTLQGQQVEDWTDHATTTDTEINLSGLDRGVEYDFRVLASNATGDSTASNVVSVVL